MRRSEVGLKFPREKAKIRGANRRRIVAIQRDYTGEADFMVFLSQHHTLEEVREARYMFRQSGSWMDKHTKRRPETFPSTDVWLEDFGPGGM